MKLYIYNIFFIVKKIRLFIIFTNYGILFTILINYKYLNFLLKLHIIMHIKFKKNVFKSIILYFRCSECS